MGFILFILLLASAVLAYQFLVKLEAEIRAEIAAAETRSGSNQPAPEPRRKEGPGTPLEERICQQVRLVPGILQSGLYARLPGDDRKMIQKSVIDLVRSGRLVRVRSGSSYKLTSVE